MNTHASNYNAHRNGARDIQHFMSTGIFVCQDNSGAFRPHVGTDPVSVQHLRQFGLPTAQYIPSLADRHRADRKTPGKMEQTDGTDRHGVCPYMRAERPSWHTDEKSGGDYSQTDPVLHQRVRLCSKQTLFYTSGSDFTPNRPCFTPAGQTLPQTDPVLHQRVRLYLKQTLFYTSGSDFASNSPCFTPAGQTLPQTDPGRE